MTSENNLNINPEASTNEEEKTIIEEELPTTIDIKVEQETVHVPVEEPTASDEEKQMNIEKSDSDSEKEKHDVLFKSESETTDDEMDGQPLFEQPVILEGKRSRKPTLRLEISELVHRKKELPIPQGHGKPLGEIEYINHQITHASTDTLSRMRQICLGRRANKTNIRKHLRDFNGFEFERNSNEYRKSLSNLTKLKKDQLRSISNILGLSSSGRNTDHAERILNFLIEPVDEGKRIPRRKSTARASKKRSTNSKESVDTDQETKKQKSEVNRNPFQIDDNEQELDYVYKPGKTSSKKHSTSTDIKRKKGASTENEETVKVNETDHTDSKIDQNVNDII